jgi:hypothetical protein
VYCSCPQELTKYCKKEKPYPRKDGLVTAYYICSKCTASIHLATNTTSTIVRRAHVPQCEQLIVKPEKTVIVKDVKQEMNSLSKDMAADTTLTNRQIAKEVIRQTEEKLKGAF